MNYREQKDNLKAENYLVFPNDIIGYNLLPKAFSVFVYLVYLIDDIQDKLTRDYNEICYDLKHLIEEKYSTVRNANSIDEILKIL